MFTHCTTWVSPTAAFVSGGARTTPEIFGQLLVAFWPIPSKFKPMVAPMRGPGVDTDAPLAEAARGFVGRTGTTRRVPGAEAGASTGRSRSGGEVSNAIGSFATALLM